MQNDSTLCLELFETIAQDVLCVNYIVDTNPSHLEQIKKVINETELINVARRVIINKCNVPCGPIIGNNAGPGTIGVMFYGDCR